MPRPLVCLSLALAAFAGAAQAQGTSRAARGIPVERDLERFQRLEDRLDRGGTGSVGAYAPYYGYDSPYYVPGGRVAAPHVPGFGGPPGGVLRDSVGNSGPLPPGSPVNVGNE
jgi:hypothetical protein